MKQLLSKVKSYIKDKLIKTENISMLIVLALTLAVFIEGYFIIASCDNYVSDEVYYVTAAKNIGIRVFGINVSKKEYPNIPNPKENLNLEHPPLAKYIMFFSMLLGGDNGFSWRIPGLIFMALMIILVYFTTYKISGSYYSAILASTVLAFDPILKPLSYIAMLDIYVAFFLLLSMLLMVYRKYFSSFIAYGLALGSKLTSIFTLPALICIAYLEGMKIRRIILGLFLAFIVYIALWLPFLTYFSLQNGSLIYGFNKVLEEHVSAMKWHLSSKGGHEYSSPPWGWLFNYNVWPIYSGLSIHSNIYLNMLFLILPIVAIILKVPLKERHLYAYFWFLSSFFGFTLIYLMGSTTQFIFYSSTYEFTISIGVATLLVFIVENIEKRRR